MLGTKNHSAKYIGLPRFLRGAIRWMLLSISLIPSIFLFSENLKADEPQPQLILPAPAMEHVHTEGIRSYLTLSSNLSETYSWSEKKKSIFDENGPNASSEAMGLRGVYLDFSLAPFVGSSGFQYRVGLALTNPTAVPSGSLRPGAPDIEHDETGFRLGFGYKYWRAYADFSLLFPIANSGHEDYKITNGFLSAYELDAGFEIHQKICIELFYKEFQYTVEPANNSSWLPLDTAEKVVGTRLRLRL